VVVGMGDGDGAKGVWGVGLGGEAGWSMAGKRIMSGGVDGLGN